jgi:hypothetical protein
MDIASMRANLLGMRLAVVPFALRHAGHPAGPVGWAAYAAIAAFLIAYMGAVIWFCIWSLRRWRPGDDDADEGGGGGSGRRGDPPPPVGPPDCDPEWWPEFERQFAAYVTRQLTCV